jgi:hypothetical protein
MRFNAELNEQLPTFPNAEKKSRKILEKSELVGSGTLFQGCGFWAKVFLKREHYKTFSRSMLTMTTRGKWASLKLKIELKDGITKVRG